MEILQEPDKKHSLFESAAEQRVVFFLVSLGIFVLTFGVFYLIDFLPEKPTEANERETAALEEVAEEESSDSAVAAIAGVAEEDEMEPLEQAPVDRYPVSITIDTLDREVRVLNPTSSAVTDLDTALLSGVVRHPDSADFGSGGTIFLFGHSSYLPNVINKNFQAFNGIQKLTWGDKVRLRSADTEYVYRVDRVYQVKASGAEVEIEQGEPKLVLSTCNSFGSKDDRFIVEASLLSTEQL